MKEEIINFETAKLARKKGFSNYAAPFCFHENEGIWCNSIDIIKSKRVFAPTQSLLQKWLRETHNSHIMICPKQLPDNSIKYYLFKGKIKKDFNELYDTYEAALEAGLQEALKLIQDHAKDQD